MRGVTVDVNLSLVCILVVLAAALVILHNSRYEKGARFTLGWSCDLIGHDML